MRVKQLVEKLAQMGMEKDRLHTKLIKERCKYEETLLFLQQEHQRVLKERSYILCLCLYALKPSHTLTVNLTCLYACNIPKHIQ